MKLTLPFVLASSSPRRHQLLKVFGFPFIIEPSSIPESPGLEETPEAYSVRLATEKAQDVADRYPEALILGADTVVVHEGDILEKPVDAAHAHDMLRRLSGNPHRVVTSVALVHPLSRRVVSGTETTIVHMAPLTDGEIEAYVATGSPFDKAGGYGIQDDMGTLFVQAIEGDFYTVMGLPLQRLYRILNASFGDLVSD